ALDGLCRPALNSGPWQNTANSFWWRHDRDALVRSRRWLWQEGTVPPAEPFERVTASSPRSRGLRPDLLPLLPRLNYFPVQPLIYSIEAFDRWRVSLGVIAALSPVGLHQICNGGTTWEALSPADRDIVSRMFAPSPGEPVPGFHARVWSQFGGSPELNA